MQEYSIVQALLNRVEAEATARNATAIHRLYVRIGELSGVEASLLATAFQLFREKTLCEGTELEIESVPVRWECRSCGQAIPRGAALRCVGCGGGARLVEGGEIGLSRVEMEGA